MVRTISFAESLYTLVSPSLCPASPSLRDFFNDLISALTALVDSFIIKPTIEAFRAICTYDNFICASIGRFDKVDETYLPLTREQKLEFEASVRRARRNHNSDTLTDLEWSALTDSTPTLGDLIEGRKALDGRKRNGRRKK